MAVYGGSISTKLQNSVGIPEPQPISGLAAEFLSGEKIQIAEISAKYV